MIRKGKGKRQKFSCGEGPLPVIFRLNEANGKWEVQCGVPTDGTVVDEETNKSKSIPCSLE